MTQTTEKYDAWPMDFGAVTLFVADLEVAKEFYHRAFGLPVIFEDNVSAVFKFGDMLVNLLKSTEATELVAPATVAGRDVGARFAFSLAVDDVEGMCIELQERGVTMLNRPMIRPGFVRTACFADPDGFIWEIVA